MSLPDPARAGGGGPRPAWLDRASLGADLQTLLHGAPSVATVESRDDLLRLAMGPDGGDLFEVSYDLPGGGGAYTEATVARCRNGLAVNYTEDYMRRRDPECMVVADTQPSDKPRFDSRFDGTFEDLRSEIFAWLAAQRLLLIPFRAGDATYGYDALLVCPENAAFFAAALADLQSMIPASRVADGFAPRAVIYIAPPFRHSHCGGKQVVIHNRRSGVHEVVALNLYPGPSAKKGVYGVLLNIGEEEGWVTLHGSTVQVVTPYDNVLTITHEGASGGGKSEMTEYPHRTADGRLELGENLVTGEVNWMPLQQGCSLRPVTDDMALCHPELQDGKGKLVVTDAEAGWFVRINHIDHYGTDPHLEELCVHPPEPLVFLNIDAAPRGTALLWDHTLDADGRPCPNPRVILPRSIVPNIVHGPVTVDLRSFGVRMPPCTREEPTYGVAGFLHLLPPALAWLWRLVSPRGHANPSITAEGGLTSEGVGSYWPFATGRRVDQANLLLDQIEKSPATKFTLSPNQHVGCWRVGFMPQWVAREYLARRGATGVEADTWTAARCPLLGYTPKEMRVEGTRILTRLLRVHEQPEVGTDGYDAGAGILTEFFLRELAQYADEAELRPLGKRIIECCRDGGSADDYAGLL